MHVAERTHWTRAAIQDLRDRGAVVYEGERCRNIADGIVVTERRRINTGLIIGADGPKSAVRRHLGLPSAVSVIARQIVLPTGAASAAGLLPFCPGVWFDYGLFGPGYGWAFPLTDTLKVGCGVSVDTHDAAALSRTFRQWLHRLGIPMDAGIHQAGSIGCRYAGHRFGRIFLAGDAGGFADPITGEGISQALISGREVAKEALEPAYRSAALEKLITSRRRTLELLFHPVIGRLLYNHTPLLLQSRWLAQKVMRRFVYSDAAMDRTSA
jgi:geranylgeranyl reductase